jgi:dTMP kinase
LLGGEVADDRRGRVFAFVGTGARIILIAAIGLSGVLVGAGSSRRLNLFGSTSLAVSTTRVLLFAAGISGVLVGLISLREIDDRPGVPLHVDLWNSLRRKPTVPPELPGQAVSE